VNVPAVYDVAPPIFNVLELPRSVPLENVQAPVNVCVNPAPRSRVPPDPLSVNAPPLTLSVSVAVPAVFVIDTAPVVVNPSILCAATVPVIVTPPEPLVNVPAFIKSPSKVKRLVPGVSVAPLMMFKGTLVLLPSTLGALNVTVPLFITTPPVARKGVIHSGPAVAVWSYCKVADAPYVGATEAVAVPAILRILFTVTPVVVFAPLPLSVRLLYATAFTVCAPAPL